MKAGDRVICIDDGWTYADGRNHKGDPVKNHIYVIGVVHSGFGIKYLQFLKFGAWVYSSECFRLIDDNYAESILEAIEEQLNELAFAE